MFSLLIGRLNMGRSVTESGVVRIGRTGCVGRSIGSYFLSVRSRINPH